MRISSDAKPGGHVREERLVMMVVDRFEGPFAVVEGRGRQMVRIERRLLPADAREGDVLRPTDDGRYVVDEVATLRRRAEVDELTRDLWGPRD